MATVGGTCVFLANVAGFVMTSALAYFCTAAAGFRSRPKSAMPLSAGFEDDCERWLHDCAASSMDGTFSQAKQKICIMAATESCSVHFQEKQSNSTTLLGSYYHSNRRRPLGLGEHTVEGVFIPSSTFATGKLQPSSRLVLSPAWTLVGCNTIVWASVYVLCIAAKKAHARRLSRAPRVSNDGNLVGVDAGGASDASAGVAAGGGAGIDGVGRSSAANGLSVERSQHAPMASASSQLAASSPGLVSPPNIRNAKRAGGTAAAKSSENNSCSPVPSSSSESKNVEIPNMMTAEKGGNLSLRCSPTITSGGAKPTREEKPTDKREERGKTLESPGPALRLPRSSSAPSALISLEAKPLGEGNSEEVSASKDLVCSNKASSCLGMRYSEAERKLGKTIGIGQPNGLSPTIPLVASPEAVPAHPRAPASDSLEAAPSASDGSGSRERAPSAASVSDPAGSNAHAETLASLLDMPSTPPTTYSSRRYMLGEECAKSASPHDVSNREHDVTLSGSPKNDVVFAGLGNAVPQATDVIGAGTLDVALPSDETIESTKDDWTKGHLGSCTSWVAPPQGSPAGLNVKCPGPDVIQFAGFAASRSPLSGPRKGVEETKGPSSSELSRPRVHQELTAHASLDDIGDRIAEVKCEAAYEVSSVAVEQGFGANACSGVIADDVVEPRRESSDIIPLFEKECGGHSRSNGITGVVGEAKQASECQVSSTEQHREIEREVHLGFAGGGATEEKGVSISQISSAEKVGELETHDGIGTGSAEQSGTPSQRMSSAEKEMELKVVLGLIKSSAKSHPAMESEDQASLTNPNGPKWGNMSTNVPLEERHRRNQELFDALQQPREAVTEDLKEDVSKAQPAGFPDESTWPSGDGHAEWDGSGDRLPPPSAYEVQEAAKMMDVYNQALRDLGYEP